MGLVFQTTGRVYIEICLAYYNIIKHPFISEYNKEKKVRHLLIFYRELSVQIIIYIYIYIYIKVYIYLNIYINCDLCLAEKVALARYKSDGLLNKQTKLLSKCRHRNKFIIANVK